MPVSVPVNQTVVFVDMSSSDASAWLWSFGDGVTSVLQNPTHKFTVVGVYLVTLAVTGSHGTAVQSDVVTVTLGGSFGPWTVPITNSSASVPGENPQVMLRISNDAGKTWIAEIWRSAGKLGEYARRVRWNRLGQARRRVYEVSVTDAIPWRVTGAFLKAQSAKDK